MRPNALRAFAASLGLVSMISPIGVLASERQERVPDEILLARARSIPDRLPLGPVHRTDSPALAGVPWASLGPTPIARLYNPDGAGPYESAGRVVSIALDPRNENIAYIAAAQGGVWKTVNGGASWTPLTDHLGSLSSGCVTLDPTNPDIIWYGTGEQHFAIDCFYGDGLYRSTDAGSTWGKVALTTSVGSYISRVAVKPSNSNIIFVGSERGVVRSMNGGTSWSTVLAPMSYRGGSWCTDLVIDPLTPSTVWAAIRDVGIYKSTNDGSTWTEMLGTTPETDGGFQRINMAIAPSNPQVLYASFVLPNGRLFGIYRTMDGGTSWPALSAPDYLQLGSTSVGQGWYDNVLVVSPTNADVCFAGGCSPSPTFSNALIRTTDGGTSWTGVAVDVMGNPVHPDIHALTIGPSSGVLWVGCDGGVWTSADQGGHWTDRNGSLCITQLYSIATHPTSSSIILAGSQDNGSVVWDGSMWVQAGPGDGTACAIAPSAPVGYYVTYPFLSPVLYTTDPFNYPFSSYLDLTGPWVNPPADLVDFAQAPIALDPLDPNVFYVGTQRLWQSLNGGLTYPLFTTSLMCDVSGTLRSIGLGTGPPHAIFAGGTDGCAWFTSDTSLVVWNRSAGLPPGAALNDLNVSPADWTHVFVSADTRPNASGSDPGTVSGPRVFETTNAGALWTSVTGDLPDGIAALSLAVDFRENPPALYLGTDYGIYASTDGGAHWIRTSKGLPNVAVYALELDLNGNFLVAATHGRGVWRSPLPLDAAVNRPGDVAGTVGGSITLEQPIVEPTGRIRFRFIMPDAGRVGVDIFDPRGRRVASFDGDVAQGRGEIIWSPITDAGRRLSSGAYSARVRSSTSTAVRSFVLLK